MFLFAVARWGQRNVAAELWERCEESFLFAVARWGQRNPTPSGAPLTSTNDVRLHTRAQIALAFETRRTLSGTLRWSATCTPEAVTGQ